ncbi:MAG: ABC transporter permease [Myxococcota bacterium]
MTGKGMRAADAFWLALDNLAEHKLRSGLTMLGMMFGVGAVIAMLSRGGGAEQQARAQNDHKGVRNVVIRAVELKPDQLKEMREKSLGVSSRDVAAIREAVPGIEVVAPELEIEPYKVLAAGGKTEAKVRGVSRDYADLVHLELAAGRFFDLRDERAHAQVAVLGAGARRDLFGVEPALGKHLKVNDVWLEVVGVLAGDSLDGSSVEGVSIDSTAHTIYVPFTTGLRKFEREPLDSPLREIVIRLDDGVSPQTTAAVVGALLTRLHSGVKDYEIIVPEALLEQNRATQRLFNIVMGCIAGISLLVGGIGIMNIMLASVLEQTREIGVRRAVGALRSDIRMQFLVTSFAISVLGGVAGIILGVGIARIVAAYADWPTVVTPASILVSTGVSISVGLISGLYPAIRAARLSPIEALRHE